MQTTALLNRSVVRALRLAGGAASVARHSDVSLIDILVGIYCEGAGPGAEILRDVGFVYGRCDRVSNLADGSQLGSRDALAAVVGAKRFAAILGGDEVTTAHLLYGILAADIRDALWEHLAACGVDGQELMQALRAVFGMATEADEELADIEQPEDSEDDQCDGECGVPTVTLKTPGDGLLTVEANAISDVLSVDSANRISLVRVNGVDYRVCGEPAIINEAISQALGQRNAV